MNIIFVPEAREEFFDTIDYYEEARGKLAVGNGIRKPAEDMALEIKRDLIVPLFIFRTKTGQ